MMWRPDVECSYSRLVMCEILVTSITNNRCVQPLLGTISHPKNACKGSQQVFPVIISQDVIVVMEDNIDQVVTIASLDNEKV
eukprot:6457165-Amphidinium_carterae.2